MADLGTSGELRLEVLNPAREIVHPNAQFISVKATRDEYDYQDFKVQMSLAHAKDWIHETYDKGNGLGAQSAYETLMEEWGFRLYYRDDVFADVHPVFPDDIDPPDGAFGPEDILLDFECIGWTDWFLSSRLLMQSTLVRVSLTGTVDQVLSDIIGAQFTNAGRPPTYASAGGDRTNSGSFTVTSSTNGTHATTVDPARWDHGRSLLDNAREWCRAYDLDLRGSWTGTTYDIFVYDAPLGSDKSTGGSRVEFNRANKGLKRFERHVDRMRASSIFEVRGKAALELQHVGHIQNAAYAQRLGERETGETYRSAWFEQITSEKLYLNEQLGGADTSYNIEIEETPELQYGPSHDFDQFDTIIAYCEYRDLTVTERLVRVELESGSPAKLRFGFGRYSGHDPSGGGGNLTRGSLGHRRAGRNEFGTMGHPENHVFIEHNDGTTKADEVNDRRLLKGDEAHNCVGIWTRGVDPGDEEDTIEESWLAGCMYDAPSEDPPSVIMRIEGKLCGTAQCDAPTGCDSGAGECITAAPTGGGALMMTSAAQLTERRVTQIAGVDVDPDSPEARELAERVDVSSHLPKPAPRPRADEGCDCGCHDDPAELDEEPEIPERLRMWTARKEDFEQALSEIHAELHERFPEVDDGRWTSDQMGKAVDAVMERHGGVVGPEALQATGDCEDTTTAVNHCADLRNCCACIKECVLPEGVTNICSIIPECWPWLPTECPENHSVLCCECCAEDVNVTMDVCFDIEIPAPFDGLAYRCVWGVQGGASTVKAFPYYDTSAGCGGGGGGALLAAGGSVDGAPAPTLNPSACDLLPEGAHLAAIVNLPSVGHAPPRQLPAPRQRKDAEKDCDCDEPSLTEASDLDAALARVAEATDG